MSSNKRLWDSELYCCYKYIGSIKVNQLFKLT